jgi:hypothetical protein
MKRIDSLREMNQQMCLAQGLSVRPYGNAWHIEGRGVSIVVAELAYLQPSDLQPVYLAHR